jgi:hypothetical protein
MGLSTGDLTYGVANGFRPQRNFVDPHFQAVSFLFATWYQRVSFGIFDLTNPDY